jgi:ribosomal protein L16/L10AE
MLICFSLRFNKLKTIEHHSFKNRNFFKSKKEKLIRGNLGFSTSGVLTCKTCRFEYAHINVIKRYLKFFLRFKYTKFKITKIWIFLKANFPISKKSKNSRMGKGVGSFVRWAIKLPRGFLIMEFFNISNYRVLKLLRFWRKRLGFPIKFIEKN